MALRKEELLFKKVFAKKSITEESSARPFYSEPYTAPLSSYPTDMYTQIARLPDVAPPKWAAGSYSSGDIVWLNTGTVNLCYIANTGTSATPPHADWTLFTPLKYIYEQELSATAGAPYGFQHNNLLLIIMPVVHVMKNILKFLKKNKILPCTELHKLIYVMM